MTTISGQHDMVAAGAAGAAGGWALASLALCMLLPSLGISIANVALPTLAERFGAPLPQVQWVVLAYLLATTLLVVVAGRLGDVTGRRRLLLAGIVVFALGSALCGIAPGLGGLIAARALQGAGAAAMMALTMAFASEVVPKARIGRAMGLLGTMSAVGTALGPSLGGLLIAGFGWQSIFLVNLPLTLLAGVLAWRGLPADRPSSLAARPRFDHRGAILLALTLGAYALAMTGGGGHFGAVNGLLLALAALGLVLFVRAESRAASPLIRLSRLRDPVLGAGLAMNGLVSTVMMATLVVGPFYLGRALGLDTASVGLVLSAGPLVAALAGVPAGRIVDRIGARRTGLWGLAGMLAGCAVLSLTRATLGIAGYVVPLVLVTVHYALFQAANNTAVMADVAADQRGVVSGLVTLSRNLGLITGASMMGTVFMIASRSAELATASPAAIAAGTRVTFAVATALVAVAFALPLLRPAGRRHAPQPAGSRS